MAIKPRAYVERERFILDACRGKRVLHLGCVGLEYCGDDVRVEAFDKSLHRRLTDIADVTGIDTSAGVIEGLAQRGLANNILVGDAEQLDQAPLEGKVDVVVAGDIIEHLANPGRMLQGIRRFCSPESRVIITTPNTHGLPRYLRFLFGRFRENDEHVTSFNFENVHHLLSRCGYTVESLHTCFQARARSRSPVFWLGRKLFQCCPKLGGTILVVARLA